MIRRNGVYFKADITLKKKSKFNTLRGNIKSPGDRPINHPPP